MERHNYNTSGTRGRVLGALPSLRPRHTSPQQDAIASQEPQGNIAQELRLGKWHTDMDVPRGGGACDNLLPVKGLRLLGKSGNS